MPTLRIDFINDDGDDDFINVPAEVIVCTRCGGSGVHDCWEGGMTASEMHEQGDEFMEDYFSGHYDTICTVCDGRNVQTVIDYECLDSYQERIVREHETYLYEMEMERRYGY